MILAVAVGPKGSVNAANGAALPGYFYRLSARAQRAYLKSDSIDQYDLAADPSATSLTELLMQSLLSGAPPRIERAAQSLGNRICALVAVPGVRVEVRGVRPHNTRGELHGIF